MNCMRVMANISPSSLTSLMMRKYSKGKSAMQFLILIFLFSAYSTVLMLRTEDCWESTMMKMQVTSCFFTSLMKGCTNFLFILPSDMIKHSFFTSTFTSSSSTRPKTPRELSMKAAMERSWLFEDSYLNWKFPMMCSLLSSSSKPFRTAIWSRMEHMLVLMARCSRAMLIAKVPFRASSPTAPQCMDLVSSRPIMTQQLRSLGSVLLSQMRSLRQLDAMKGMIFLRFSFLPVLKSPLYYALSMGQSTLFSCSSSTLLTSNDSLSSFLSFSVIYDCILSLFSCLTLCSAALISFSLYSSSTIISLSTFYLFLGNCFSSFFSFQYYCSLYAFLLVLSLLLPFSSLFLPYSFLIASFYCASYFLALLSDCSSLSYRFSISFFSSFSSTILWSSRRGRLVANLSFCSVSQNCCGFSSLFSSACWSLMMTLSSLMNCSLPSDRCCLRIYQMNYWLRLWTAFPELCFPSPSPCSLLPSLSAYSAGSSSWLSTSLLVLMSLRPQAGPCCFDCLFLRYFYFDYYSLFYQLLFYSSFYSPSLSPSSSFDSFSPYDASSGYESLLFFSYSSIDSCFESISQGCYQWSMLYQDSLSFASTSSFCLLILSPSQLLESHSLFSSSYPYYYGSMSRLSSPLRVSFCSRSLSTSYSSPCCWSRMSTSACSSPSASPASFFMSCSRWLSSTSPICSSASFSYPSLPSWGSSWECIYPSKSASISISFSSLFSALSFSFFSSSLWPITCSSYSISSPTFSAPSCASPSPMPTPSPTSSFSFCSPSSCSSLPQRPFRCRFTAMFPKMYPSFIRLTTLPASSPSSTTGYVWTDKYCFTLCSYSLKSGWNCLPLSMKGLNSTHRSCLSSSCFCGVACLISLLTCDHIFSAMDHILSMIYLFQLVSARWQSLSHRPQQYLTALLQCSSQENMFLVRYLQSCLCERVKEAKIYSSSERQARMINSFDWLLWCSPCSSLREEKTRLLSTSYSSSSPIYYTYLSPIYQTALFSTAYLSSFFSYSISPLSSSYSRSPPSSSYSCSLSYSQGYFISMRRARPSVNSLMVEKICFSSSC